MRDLLSKRFTLLSILAAFSVVVIHSFSAGMGSGVARWNLFAQYLVTGSFTKWAVPFFFLQSGYWLIRKSDDYSTMCRKKFRSLVVPYLLWAIAGALVITPLVAVNNILAGRSWWLRTVFAADDVVGFLDLLFGVTVLGPRGDEPLWFVKNLIILFAFAPIWKLIVSRASWLALAVWFTEIFVYPVGVDQVKLLPGSIGWFALGTFIASGRWEEKFVSPRLIGLSAVLWTIFAIVRSAMGTLALNASSYGVGVAEGCAALFGIIVLWGLSERLVNRVSDRFWNLGELTFGVYCIHILISGYLMAAWLKILGKSDVSTFVCAIILPIAVACLSVITLRIWRRYLPKLYSAFAGGRA